MRKDRFQIAIPYLAVFTVNITFATPFLILLFMLSTFNSLLYNTLDFKWQKRFRKSGQVKKNVICKFF